MTRREFSPTDCDKAFKRANGLCGRCRQPLQIGRIEYDHILPCALGGDNSPANIMVLCTPCHREKTSKEDIPRIRKADRQRRNHIGAKQPKGNIKSPGFKPAPPQRRASKPVEKLSTLPRRELFEEISK